MDRINIDPFSILSSQLEMRFGDTLLSKGTCFFWEIDSIRYLVTNWHNLSGINPITGKHLSPTGGEPDRVTFDIWIDQDINKAGWATIEIEVDGSIIWNQHPRYGSGVDVACIRLPNDVAPHVFPINLQNQEKDIILGISHEVFILGFPMGVGPERLPVWKKASVATEPDIDVEQLPKFLVDTATAQGMSGSPVILRTSTGRLKNGASATFARPVSRFVGIYSGRISSGNSLEAQLGIVWKARVIDEIIQGGRLGSKEI